MGLALAPKDKITVDTCTRAFKVKSVTHNYSNGPWIIQKFTQD